MPAANLRDIMGSFYLFRLSVSESIYAIDNDGKPIERLPAEI
jgi:hypothetical protein